MKRIFFLADTLDEIRSFPLDVRKDIGTELRRVQRGVEPMDWRPMKTVGLVCGRSECAMQVVHFTCCIS